MPKIAEPIEPYEWMNDHSGSDAATLSQMTKQIFIIVKLPDAF